MKLLACGLSGTAPTQDGRIVQITGATVTNLGSATFDGGDENVDTSSSGAQRHLIAYPNISKGRVEIFAYLGRQVGRYDFWATYDGLALMPVTGVSGVIAVGDTMTGGTSGATALVDHIDEVTGTNIFVNTVVDGTGPFSNGESLAFTPSGASATAGTISGDTAGDAWYRSHTSTSSNPDNAASRRSHKYHACGFHPVIKDGTPHLAIVYLRYVASGEDLIGIARYDSVNDAWSATAVDGGLTINTLPGHNCCFNNIIYISDRGNATARIVAVDPSTANGSASVVTAEAVHATYKFSRHFAPFRGDLYLIQISASDSAWSIQKLSSGSFSRVATLAGTPSLSANSRGYLFESPEGELCAAISGGNGTKIFYITNYSTWASSEIPASLGAFASLVDNRIWTIVDRAANGAVADPETYLYFSNTPASGSVAVARLDDISTFTDIGSFAGAKTYWFSDAPGASGEFVYEPGVSNYPILTGGLTDVANGQRFSYRVYGSGTVSFELLVENRAISGDAGATTDSIQRGTLSSPSEGSLADAGKKITGVSADGNEKTAVWLGSSDGFSEGDSVARRPYISA